MQGLDPENTMVEIRISATEWRQSNQWSGRSIPHWQKAVWLYSKRFFIYILRSLKEDKGREGLDSYSNTWWNFFFLFQLGSKYKATDLDEANTSRVTWEKCVKKQGMVGVACFSSQYTRQGDLEFKANLRYIGTGPRNPHHDPVFKPCFRNRKPKGLKSNRGMAAYTCVWEPWEERFSEEDHFSSGVWGHSGQHRELFTYNTIQQQQKQENQYLYW